MVTVRSCWDWVRYKCSRKERATTEVRRVEVVLAEEMTRKALRGVFNSGEVAWTTEEVRIEPMTPTMPKTHMTEAELAESSCREGRLIRVVRLTITLENGKALVALCRMFSIIPQKWEGELTELKMDGKTVVDRNYRVHPEARNKPQPAIPAVAGSGNGTHPPVGVLASKPGAPAPAETVPPPENQEGSAVH